MKHFIEYGAGIQYPRQQSAVNDITDD